MIHTECDLYVPRTSQILSQSGKTSRLINSFGELIDNGFNMSAANIDTSAFPTKEQRGMLSIMSNAFGTSVSVIGEDFAGNDWSLMGTLKPDHQRVEIDDMDGMVSIVGPVVQIVKTGEQKSLFELPGLLSRKQRRSQQVKKINLGSDDDSTIDGPALILSVLAIYR